jgi:hypothetical protein
MLYPLLGLTSAVTAAHQAPSCSAGRSGLRFFVIPCAKGALPKGTQDRGPRGPALESAFQEPLPRPGGGWRRTKPECY